MKTTKVFLTAVMILFGFILTDGNAKTTESNGGNPEWPRRRVIEVSQHCNVRPIVRYERRERREEYRERREDRREEYREHRERERR